MHRLFNQSRAPGLVSDEGGFTLVEMMIAGALVLLIAFGVSSMLVYMKKHQAKSEDRSIHFEKQQAMSYMLRFNPPPP